MSADKYPSIFPCQMDAIDYLFPNLQNYAPCEKDFKDTNTIASIWGKNVPAYLSLDIICSSKLTVFLELCSQKSVRYIFSRQMEAMVLQFI